MAKAKTHILIKFSELQNFCNAELLLLIVGKKDRDQRCVVLSYNYTFRHYNYN